MNTILFRDKVLIRTLSSPIYQNENRADSLKFLISANDLPEFKIETLTCMLCVTLPDGQEGKIALLNFENVLYQEKYLTSFVPLTKALTKHPGIMSLNLIFSYEDENTFFHYLPTNNITLTILESSSTDSFIDPDETTNSLTELAQKLEALEKSKISSIEIDGHTVHFYSDTEKSTLIGTIDLPEDVVWTTMEDL